MDLMRLISPEVLMSGPSMTVDLCVGLYKEFKMLAWSWRCNNPCALSHALTCV